MSPEVRTAYGAALVLPKEVSIVSSCFWAAAMLAGVGVGEYASFSEPQAAFVRPAGRYEPDESRRQRYDELYAVYRDIYPAVAPIAHRL